MRSRFPMDFDWNHLQGSSYNGFTDSCPICFFFEVGRFHRFALWINRLWNFSEPSIPHFLVLQIFDLMATIDIWETQFLLFHNLIAVINGLLFERFTLPNTMDTVLPWALISALSLTTASKLLLRSFGCLLSESHWFFRDHTLMLSCYSKGAHVQLPALVAKYSSASS